MTSKEFPLTTEMRLRERSGDEATVKDLPVTVMQALYHEITGRTETLERKFWDDFVFRHEDIIQAIYKLVQAIQQYNVTAADAQFEVSFSNGEKQTFSSLEKFKQIDSTRPQKTSNCRITVAFLLATPGVGKYQNYRISIHLRSVGKRDTELLRWGYHRPDEPCASIDVEYIDFVVLNH